MPASRRTRVERGARNCGRSSRAQAHCGSYFSLRRFAPAKLCIHRTIKNYCTTTLTTVFAVCAPAVAVMFTGYVPAGVPVCPPPPPPPPHAASAASEANTTSVASAVAMRRAPVPCRFAANDASSMASAASSAKAPTLLSGLLVPLPREFEFVEGGANNQEVFSCSADEPELRAVVVTVTVEPLAEHEPSGIEQLTVSVGVVEKPVVLTGMVTVL